MRKKLIYIFMTAALFVTSLGITTTFVHGEEVSSSALLDKCMEIGKNFIHDYYYTIDMKKDMDINQYVNKKEVFQYIDLKHEIMKNRKVRSNINVSDFSVDTSCYDYDVTDNKVEITYNVKVKHQYTGCDEMSESGQRVKLGFENNNGLISITDYFEITDFDINVSLAQKKSVNTERVAVSSNENNSYKLDFGAESIKILKDTLTEENSFYDKLDLKAELYKKDEISISDGRIDSNNYVGILSVSSTVRNNMATYATANCTKASPSSGNSSYASYYDFSQISGAHDCTNFMSHCLLAGGAVENHNKWYYDSLSARSPSWSGVDQFHDFIVSNTGTGPKAEGESLAYSCPPQYINWEKGDVIQLKEANYNPTGFGHSTMVTGTYAQNSYVTIPMVTSRTGVDWYTKNEILTEKYPIGSKIVDYRLIHITSLT